MLTDAAAAREEAKLLGVEGHGIGVRKQVEPWTPGASGVDEVVARAHVGARPPGTRGQIDAEENEGSFRGENGGLVGEAVPLQSRAMDGEVGITRRIDESEGHLDDLALARLGFSRGRVPAVGDVRCFIQHAPVATKRGKSS